MMKESQVHDEIAAIHRELADLKIQMSTASLNSSTSSLNYNDTDNNNDDDDDDDDDENNNNNDTKEMQHSVKQLLERLTQERKKRQQLEEDIQIMRVTRKQSNVESLNTIELKQQELDKLTRERDELQEWLQRGVIECRRVADETLKLKCELHEKTQHCESLETTVLELQEKIQTLQQQLMEAQLKLEQSKEKEQLLELCANEHAFSVQKLEEMNEKRRKEYETLITEVEIKRQRIISLDESEMCVQLLIERLQQLQTHMLRLGQAVRRGYIEDISPDEFFIRENVAEPQKPLEELIIRAKTLLRTFVSAVQELRIDISKFMSEQHRLHVEQESTHREHLEAAHLEKQAELHKYDKEREFMQQEIAKLKSESLHLLTKCAKYEAEEEDRQEGRIGEIESIMNSNKQLSKENDELRKENATLQSKLHRLRIDWRKVHESQQRFQQLQVEVDMIAQANEKIQKENENLKLLIETRFGIYYTQDSQNQQIQQNDFINGKNITSPSFSRPNISVILADDNSGKRHLSNSPSRRRVEHEVFQEWKRAVLTDYV